MNDTTTTEPLTLVAELDAMSAGWLCAGLPDADLPQRAAREIERLRMHAVILAETAREVERERCATMLANAMALEGFGCACEPAFHCGTCKARDTLDKALSPLLRELKASR